MRTSKCECPLHAATPALGARGQCSASQVWGGMCVLSQGQALEDGPNGAVQARVLGRLGPRMGSEQAGAGQGARWPHEDLRWGRALGGQAEGRGPPLH